MLQCCFHVGVSFHVGAVVYRKWWLPWLIQRCRVAASRLAACQWEVLAGLGCVVILPGTGEHVTC